MTQNDSAASTRTYKGLLVGLHFNPPAKQIFPLLPGGMLLELEPDPENPYDPMAVKVLFQSSALGPDRDDEIAAALVGTSFDLDSFREMDRVMLGHLAAEGGKPLLKCQEPGMASNKTIIEAVVRAGGQYTAKLSFGQAAEPLVLVTTIDEDEAEADVETFDAD